MKRIAHIIAPLLITIAALTGCHRHDNLHPFGWKSVNPEIDSLTMRLERGWLDGADDSLLRVDIEHMRRIADTHSDMPLLGVRADYWEGRMLVREGRDEEGKALFRRALLANDSTRNPYETHRLLWALEPPSLPYTIDSYEYLLDQTTYFEQAGDMMLAASSSMDLGMFLNDIGQSSRALQWLDRADSMFILAGLERIVIANGLNRCNVIAMAGDTVEAVRQLRALTANPEFCADPQALDLARYHLFLLGRDSTAIFDAFEAVRYNPAMTDVTTLYEGFLAGIYLNRNCTDSAVYYADRAMANFDLLWNTRLRVDVLAWAGEVARLTGDIPRAQELLSQRLEEMETLIEETKREDILNHEMASKLADLEYRNDRRELRARITIVASIAAAIIAIIGIGFVYYRRLQRHKLRIVQQELQHEKTTRRLLATQVALQQKQALIGDIQRSVSTTDDATSHIVDSAIRTYKATAEGEGLAFVDTFSELHPRFMPRLREAYPTLTPADCRLLSLIAVGMSNKQIAATLGIRPESVKQSRWRLRAKMHLDSDTTLESAITPLLS
ncbi:MAG: helix-turn-helix transcriptional regulator [Bacteroidales bacterium]|nr:helix-turn-helix transcriptional regulator [Bacteroidales bacterium]MBD5211362.1 helix-turn-helix transcriptional regulator [Bacteroidales bacterium]